MNKFIKYFPLALVSLLFAPLPALAAIHLGDANTNVLSNGLVGYWPLDGSTINWSTDAVKDMSGNGNNGTADNMTQTSQAIGKIGQALQFNGSNSQWIDFGTEFASYVSPSTATLAQNAQAFTLSAWVKEPSGEFNQNIVLGKLGFNAGLLTGMCNLLDSTDSFHAVTFTPPVNTWFLETMTYNPTNQVETCYINGQSVGTASMTGTTFYTSGADMAIAGSGYFLTGSVDDARIYNRALSMQEVALLYALGSFQLGNTPAINSSFSIAQGGLNGGLVAYWPLDGNTTNWGTETTNDVSGNNNTSYMAGFATTTSPVPGVIGQALNFSASATSYMSVSNSGHAVMPTSNSPFTIALWVKPKTLSCGGSVCSIMNNETYNTSGFRFGVGPQMSDEFQFWTSESGGTIFMDSTLVAAVNTWYDAVVTYNGTTAIMYINGVQQASSVGTYIGNTNNLIIGGAIGGKANFDGPMDDIRIYNRALSAQEVAQLYQVGKVHVGESNTSPNIAINSGLVGYWTFDGPTINWATGVVKDMSGSGDNGQVESMSTSSSPVIGKIGQALNFNGTSYVQVPALGVTFTNITITCWMYSTANQGAYAGVIYSRATTGAPGLGISYAGTTNQLGYDWSNSSSEYGWASGLVVPNNQWVFVVMEVTPSGATFYMGDNGALQSATNVLSEPSITFNGVSTFGEDSQGGRNYIGRLDDIRFYDRALSQQEVAQLYAAGR